MCPSADTAVISGGVEYCHKNSTCTPRPSAAQLSDIRIAERTCSTEQLTSDLDELAHDVRSDRCLKFVQSSRWSRELSRLRLGTVALPILFHLTHRIKVYLILLVAGGRARIGLDSIKGQ